MTNQNHYRSDVFSLGGELLQIDVSYHIMPFYFLLYAVASSVLNIGFECPAEKYLFALSSCHWLVAQIPCDSVQNKVSSL